MLEKLVIKNVALIERAEIDFTDGLNVLSGETGAGKSVILESLNFVLGAKADKTLVRSGETECFVSALFDVSDNNEIKTLLSDNGFEYDDKLLISRKFGLDGKSSIKLNGEPLTSSVLRKFTAVLVDVHGQSEHYSLLKSTNQLRLIDLFGGEEIKRYKEELHELFTEYKKIKEELSTLGGDESQRLVLLDILNFQIKEIEDADLKDNEEDELLAAKQRLLYKEKIVESLGGLKELLNGENGVNDLLLTSARTVSQISNLSDEYKELSDRVYNVQAECQDIADTAESLLDGVEEEEISLDEVEERLSKIKALKKKYGETIEDINAFKEKAVSDRERLLNSNELAEILLDKKLKSEDKIYDLYLVLSDIRKKYAEEFSKRVVKELVTLGMKNAKFEIRFNEPITKEECKFTEENGIDDLSFYFSANLGEPVKPLSEIISGGEMSRFMLAIKAQTAVYNDIGTFVFDEIDAGLSGNTAYVVAQKFIEISKGAQIIAISHLPQITAFADTNFFIRKIETDDKTVTTVKKLEEDEKVIEIARLLGGDESSESAMLNAKELINKAKELKNA